MTDWALLIAELHKRIPSYRQIAAQADVSFNVVYRLATGATDEPYASSGKKLEAFYVAVTQQAVPEQAKRIPLGLRPLSVPE